MSFFFFVLLFFFVLYLTVKELRVIEINQNTLISLISTYVVFLGFLTYTFVYAFTRYFQFLDVYENENFIAKIIILLHTKAFFEHLTYFAALAALYDYLNTRYRAIRLSFLKKDEIKKEYEKVLKGYDSLKEEIKYRENLLEDCDKILKEMMKMDEPKKHKIKSEEIN